MAFHLSSLRKCGLQNVLSLSKFLTSGIQQPIDDTDGVVGILLIKTQIKDRLTSSTVNQFVHRDKKLLSLLLNSITSSHIFAAPN